MHSTTTEPAPARASGPDDPVVDSRRVHLLYERSPPALAAGLLAGLLVVAVFRHAVPLAPLLGWLALLVAVTSVRRWLVSRFEGAAPTGEALALWWRRFLLGAVAAGLVWGLAGAWLAGAGDLPRQVLLLLILAGVLFGALSAQSAGLEVFLAYLASTLAPLLVVLFLHDDELHRLMGVAVLLFAAVLVTQARQANRALLGSLREVARNTRIAAALRRNNDHLALLVRHDQLTGLLNRRGIYEALERELNRSRRHGHRFALALFDIDHFKLVNDSLGHLNGDVVLQAVTDAVAHSLRRGDVLGRWGGEEFLCLFPETDIGLAREIAERLRRTVAELRIPVQTTSVEVTASFGIAGFPQDSEDLNELVAAADAALYQAKGSGRDRCVVASSMGQNILPMGSLLQQALREGRVRPAFQPIVDLRSGELVAQQALARILPAHGEAIDARRFLEAARRLQLLHQVDRAVFLQTLEHAERALRAGRPVPVSFLNISAGLLRQTEVLQELMQATERVCKLYGEKACHPLVVDITSRDLLEDAQVARQRLAPLMDYGVALALADFGSGYASYEYLVDLPIRYLRIGKGLVQRIEQPKVRAIVQGILDIARELDLTTLAEQVEDRDTARRLRELGVDWAQGYLFGPPRLVDENRPRAQQPPLSAGPGGSPCAPHRASRP
jgi:diguanylate cyclase (GGDEF)-like protein